MKTIDALFDCDGTLYSAQYGRGLMKYAAPRGMKTAVRIYYASLLPLLVMRKLKLIPDEQFHRPLTSRMPWMIKGMSEPKFRDLAECMFREYLLTTERAEVVARLRKHQAKGHIVVAALQAPVIMTSQNRQEAKDRLRAEHDYQVNLKAELEIRHLHEKLDVLLKHQWQKLLEIHQIQMDFMKELVRRDDNPRPAK